MEFPAYLATMPMHAITEIHGEPGLLARFRLEIEAFDEADRERLTEALDLAAALLRLAHLHPREAVRALSDAMLEIAGPALADDATLLVVDWYGGHGPRRSTAGADSARVSPDEERSAHRRR